MISALVCGPSGVDHPMTFLEADAFVCGNGWFTITKAGAVVAQIPAACTLYIGTVAMTYTAPPAEEP